MTNVLEFTRIAQPEECLSFIKEFFNDIVLTDITPMDAETIRQQFDDNQAPQWRVVMADKLSLAVLVDGDLFLTDVPDDMASGLIAFANSRNSLISTSHMVNKFINFPRINHM